MAGLLGYWVSEARPGEKFFRAIFTPDLRLEVPTLFLILTLINIGDQQKGI